jgi:hypothetical protein
MFCTKCGSELKQNTKFCASCGNEAITAETNDVDSSAFVESEDELVKQFVGKNSDYYLRKWNSSQNPARRSGWNWAAFFLSVFWMAYRKMYKNTAMYILVWLLFGIVLELLHNDQLTNMLSLFLAIATGMSGNAMYYTFTKKNIEKYRSKNLEQPLEKKGRTSWGAAFVAIGSMLVGGIILTALAN